MQSALQTFFVIQVALERATEAVSNASNEFVRKHITEPVREQMQRCLGACSSTDVDKLHTEIESIRVELRGLRNDLRELQHTNAVSQ